MDVTEFYKGKRVLVTGNTGFKGSWLGLLLDEMGAEIRGYSLNPPSHPYLYEKLKYKNVKTTIGDIRDLDKLSKVVEEFKPDVAFHLAAQPILLNSYGIPKETFETNSMGTLNFLEALREAGFTKSIVVITTDKVYENSNAMLTYKEEDKLGGYDPYSSSKACAELISASYRNSFNMPIATARGGNVIGGGDWAENRLVPNIVKAINGERNNSYFLRNNKVLIRDNSIRPWTHVLDVLYGYLLLGQKLHENAKEYGTAFNFSSQYESIKTVGEFSDSFMKAYGINREEYIESFKIEHEDKWHEDRILLLDSIKARVKLGWQASFDFEDMVRDTVAWYKDNYEGKDMDGISRQAIRAYLSKRQS